MHIVLQYRVANACFSLPASMSSEIIGLYSLAKGNFGSGGLSQRVEIVSLYDTCVSQNRPLFQLETCPKSKVYYFERIVLALMGQMRNYLDECDVATSSLNQQRF